MSVVVEDARRRLQLFTKGDAEAVLDNCTQVWDGEELRPMTPQDRALIMQHHNECVQKHYKCVALSYVSLPDSVRPTIATSAQLGRTLFLDRRGGGDLHMAGAADWAEEGPREAPGPNASGSARPCRPRAAPLPGCARRNARQMRAPRVTNARAAAQAVHVPAAQDAAARDAAGAPRAAARTVPLGRRLTPRTHKNTNMQALGALEGGQIFIGMLTLRYRPMKEICDAIEARARPPRGIARPRRRAAAPWRGAEPGGAGRGAGR